MKDKWHIYAIVVVFTFVLWSLFGMARAEDRVCVLSFKLCNGVTCREFELVGEGSQMQSCVFVGPVVISAWMHENGKRDWLLQSWRCYSGSRMQGL